MPCQDDFPLSNHPLGGPSFGVEPPYFHPGGSGGEQFVGRHSLRRFYAWIPDKEHEHRCVATRWVDFRLADRIRNVMSPDAGLVVLKTICAWPPPMVSSRINPRARRRGIENGGENEPV